VVERGVLGVGAQVLCAVRADGRTLTEQMERTVPNLAAGAGLWTAVAVAVWAVV
jgi:hypothetical protein